MPSGVTRGASCQTRNSVSCSVGLGVADRGERAQRLAQRQLGAGNSTPEGG